MVVLCYRVDWWSGCGYVFEDISAVVWDVGFWGAGECHWDLPLRPGDVES